jgi:hypothetical protein
VENNSEESKVLEEAPPAKRKFPLIMVLSVLLGVSLVVVAIGGVLFFQRGKALQAEVIAVKKEIQEKNIVYAELQKQVEALSQQMNVLKEYSIARSSVTKDTELQPETLAEGVPVVLKPEPKSVATAAPSVPAVEPVATVPAKAGVAVPAAVPAKPSIVAPTVSKSNPVAATAPEIVTAVAPKVVRQKPEALSCELVGKSAEEQAATLKRCVGVMDTPREKSSAK